jgi:hypothetical protein
MVEGGTLKKLPTTEFPADTPRHVAMAQSSSSMCVLADDVAEFLVRHGLVSSFEQFGEAVQAAFTDLVTLEAELDSDPEDETSAWLTMNVTLHGTVEEVFREYNAFVARIVDEFPAPAMDSFRLSLNIQ